MAIILAVSVALVYVYDYLNIAYVYGEGLGLIARAETAQTPSELISYVVAAKNSLPERGSAAWGASDETNFRQIQQDLNLVISRAEAISALTAQNERYNSEMLEMHANLRLIQEKILIGCLAC